MRKVANVAFVLAGLASGAGLLGGGSTAQAADAASSYTTASRQIERASASVGAIEQAITSSADQQRTAAQRIGDATLLIGAKDYNRATLVLNQIIEKYPDDPTVAPDARRLLGETYFHSGQLLSARREFQFIVDHAGDRHFAAYQPIALGRLVDIVMRVGDYEALDPLIASMSATSAGGPLGSTLAYARGKGLFLKRDYATAKAALASVDAKSDVAPQARYMLGLIAVREATPAVVATDPDAAPVAAPPSRYAAAIDTFRQATQLAADTPEHAHVIDLAWLAIGRLFYETEQFTQAVQAYGHVDRTSPEFGTMLYELAWVYVRLGDVDRAQRALEVLAVSDPGSENIADGALLRADLMLRAGQFEKSLKVYEGVRDAYDPMRERVEAFLGSTSDPAVYYDRLSSEQLDAIDTSSGLPSLAITWAREAEDGPLAFAVIDEVKRSRELIKDSNRLIDRLNAVLSAPNRVRAFPDLQDGEEKALSLLNQIARARLALGQGMDDTDESSLSGEIAVARAKRRSLEKRLALVPVSAADFEERESQAMSQWNSTSQSLQRLTLQVDTLQATANGLQRMLHDERQSGVVRDPASTAQLEASLHEQELLVAGYRQQIEELQRLVNAGRVQVGFGDQRFIEDREVRKEYRDALVREVALAESGAGGGSLQAYARKLSPLLREGDAADARIEAALARIDATVNSKAVGLRDTVAREAANIVDYKVRLDTLDQEARLVVGEVAMRNFGLVRDRFKNIALKADVGITEEAWEVREEQVTRVSSLQIERAREDRLLKEELSEVLDDTADESVQEKNP